MKIIIKTKPSALKKLLYNVEAGKPIKVNAANLNRILATPTPKEK